MNLKSLFPLFMLEYAGVLREFACVCVNMLELLVFVRSLLEYAGVCLNFPGSGQVGLSGCGPVGVDWMMVSRGRLDAGRSGSTTLMRPGST